MSTKPCCLHLMHLFFIHYQCITTASLHQARFGQRNIANHQPMQTYLGKQGRPQHNLRCKPACRRQRLAHVVRAIEAASSQQQVEFKTAADVRAHQYPEFKVLYCDEHIVAIDKPRNVFMHPPEDGRPCPLEENALWLLKRQLGGTWLWPVHRIDRATSGVALYCRTREAAQHFSAQMRARKVQKSYIAMVRGFTDTYGLIDEDLGGQPSSTLYETLARCHLPVKVGKWPSVRYSLVHAKPLTGRYHQIRRHFNYISHPIINDGDHGDRYHNRAFRNDLGIPGMFLRAANMQFLHPATDKLISISVDCWEPRWEAAFEMMGACPVLPPTHHHASDTDQPEYQNSRLQEQIDAFSKPDDLRKQLAHVMELQQSPWLAELQQTEVVNTMEDSNSIGVKASSSDEGRQARVKGVNRRKALSTLTLHERTPCWAIIPKPCAC